MRTISKYLMTNPNSSTIKYSIFADFFLITPDGFSHQPVSPISSPSKLSFLHYEPITYPPFLKRTQKAPETDFWLLKRTSVRTRQEQKPDYAKPGTLTTKYRLLKNTLFL